MLNALLLNTGMLNAGTPLPTALTAADFDNLEFNGYSLQDTDVISTDILADSPPSRELVTFRTPRADGGGWNGDFFRERRVRVSGIIEATTAALLNTELDTFRKNMIVSRGNLDYKVNDEIRRIVATLENPQDMFSRRQGYHITFCPYDLTFLALEPMWHGIDYEDQTSENVTQLAYTDDIEVSGSYKAQPVIVIIFEAENAITAINFTNNTNEDEIEVTPSGGFTVGDVLVIDSEQKSVTLNGTEIDYDGVFPELEIGTNNYTITATGTSLQYTATVKYRKTYL